MKKKIKIAHVITSLKVGGAEAVLVDLIRGMPEHEHYVVYFYAGLHVQSLQKLGILTYHIKGSLCLYDPIFWIRLIRCIVQLKPDLLHGSLWAANFAVRVMGLLLKIPTMCAIHAQTNLNGFLRNCIDRFTLQYVQNIVVVSDTVKDSLSVYPWIPAKKIACIKNGIDVKNIGAIKTASKAKRSDLGLLDNDFVFGAVGRFIPEKNFLLLIDVFALVYKNFPNARLVLIGYGQQEALLRQRAVEHSVDTKIIFVIGKPAYDYYHLMDCFVQSSQQEGLSIALLEAMSCRLPCVVTYTGLKHDVIIDKKNGCLVALQDTTTFAEVLMALMQDSKMQDYLGQQAQKTVQETCDSVSMVQGYQKIYRKLLKHQR